MGKGDGTEHTGTDTEHRRMRRAIAQRESVSMMYTTHVTLSLTAWSIEPTN